MNEKKKNNQTIIPNVDFLRKLSQQKKLVS